MIELAVWLVALYIVLCAAVVAAPFVLLGGAVFLIVYGVHALNTMTVGSHRFLTTADYLLGGVGLGLILAILCVERYRVSRASRSRPTPPPLMGRYRLTPNGPVKID
jgi:hypothetical protein